MNFTLINITLIYRGLFFYGIEIDLITQVRFQNAMFRQSYDMLQKSETAY